MNARMRAFLKAVAIGIGVLIAYRGSYEALWKRETHGAFATLMNGKCIDYSVDTSEVRFEALRGGIVEGTLELVYWPLNYVLVDRANFRRMAARQNP
jgi:hypothetical protein